MRISEQEFRFTFINILESGKKDHALYYSVETPTKEKYKFTGDDERSASSDVSIYDENKNKLYNIEFKAHNAPDASIEKDMEKLLKENVDGAWFHLFENSDNGTITTLFRKFNESYKNLTIKNFPNWLIFGILVLNDKDGIIYWKKFKKDEEINFSLDNFEKIKLDEEN